MSDLQRPIDTALFDPATAASDDFYRHVNGGWLDANPVPSEYGAWGAPQIVHARNQDVLHQLLEDAAARTEPRGSAGQMVGDYFAAAMDEAAIAAAGAEPLAPYLARIDGAASVADVRAIVRDLQRRGPGPLHSLGIAPDFEDSGAYLVYVGQGGLGLPERDYYTRDDEQSATLREQYVAHVARQLGNLGDAGERARGGRRAHPGVRDPARRGVLHRRAAARRAAHDEPARRRRAGRPHARLRPELVCRGARRHFRHGQRRQPRVLPGARRHPRRHARGDAEGLPSLARGQGVRAGAGAGVRGRGVRLLRPHARRSEGDAAPVEARAQRRLRGHRRAGCAALRRGRILGTGQAALRGDGRPSPVGDGACDPECRVDERHHPGGSLAQARRLQLQDRLPGRVARLLRSRHRARLVRREPDALPVVRVRPARWAGWTSRSTRANG